MPRKMQTHSITSCARQTLRLCWRHAWTVFFGSATAAIITQVVLCLIPLFLASPYEVAGTVVQREAWAQSRYMVKDAQAWVVRRPLLFGAMYGLIPSSDTTTGGRSAEIIWKRADLLHGHSSAIWVQSLPQGKDTTVPLRPFVLVHPNIPFGEMSWHDRYLVRKCVRDIPERFYIEVLLIGWPFRVLYGSGTIAISDWAATPPPLVLKNAILRRWRAVPPVQLPGKMFYATPTGLSLSGIILNSAIFIILYGAINCSALCFLARMRRRSGKCVVCGYPQVSGCVCPECGT
jgi:hypothetical protein